MEKGRKSVASWEAISSLTGVAIALIGGAVAFGRLRQRVADMGKQMEKAVKSVEDHEKRLNDGDGTFRVIDTKLDSILKGQEETHKLLMDHILSGNGQ